MTRLMRAVLAMLAILSVPGCLAVFAAEAEPEIEGEAVVGPQWYADSDPHNSAKFEEYRDVPNGLVAERFLFSWKPKDRLFFALDAKDISQRDQRIGAEFGKLDLWKGTVLWQENPRHWTDQARMLFAGRGDGAFTLDDTLQAAIQAAPASADVAPADGEWDAGTKGALIKSAILNSANDVDLEFQRRTGRIGLQFTPTRSWTFGVQGERERRSGSTPQSLGMYFSLAPAEVAAPVDFKTDTATLSAEYTRQQWNVGAQLLGSKFETGIKSITWDDQLFLTDTAVSATTANPARGRMSPWSDSELFRWVVYGGMSLAGHTRLNATYSRSETTQDDDFLSKTTNTLLTPDPLPASSLDGKYRNNLGQVRISSRPLGWLHLSAWWRKYVYDNDTPSLRFTDYVMTDYQIPFCGNANACGATTNRLQRRNLPYGYEKTNMGASAGFKPIAWLDATVGFEREGMDRVFSAVRSSDEDIWKLALDFDVAEWLTLRATGRHQQRRADHYDAEYFLESFPIGEANIAASNEGMRRFIWTDRDRDAVSFLVEVTPTPKFSIYGEATYNKDDYFDPNTGKKIGDSFTVTEDRNFDSVDETINLLLAGRKDDRNTTYTLGATVNPTERFTLYADYTKESSKYDLETRYRAPVAGIGSDNPLDNWGSDAQDRYDTANLGFDVAFAQERKWRLSGDLSRSVGEGDIETHFVPGGNASGDTTLTQFPQLKTTLSIAQLALTRSARTNLDYSLRAWFEKWKENNFASDFMQPYMGDPGNDPGSKEAIFLGMDFADYTNYIVSFMVRYHFR